MSCVFCDGPQPKDRKLWVQVNFRQKAGMQPRSGRWASGLHTSTDGWQTLPSRAGLMFTNYTGTGSPEVSRHVTWWCFTATQQEANNDFNSSIDTLKFIKKNVYPQAFKNIYIHLLFLELYLHWIIIDYVHMCNHNVLPQASTKSC